MEAQIGVPSWQSFWEMLTCGLALSMWASDKEALAVLGDNTASLQDALDLKGSRCMLAVAREIAWRQGRRGWLFAVGHLAAEFNTAADALSRLEAPDPSPLPPEVQGARRLHLAPVASYWQIPKLG